MLKATGSIVGGTPSLKIKLQGVFSKDPAEFVGIVDTGFSGFISIPIIQAFPLGLPLYGTTNVTLADGQTQSKLIAQAKATIGGQTELGLVILEPSSTEVLIGMDFLRRFNCALFVTSNGIALLDETEVQKLIKKTAEEAEARAKAKPPEALPKPEEEKS